jgi:hypothetical protein
MRLTFDRDKPRALYARSVQFNAHVIRFRILYAAAARFNALVIGAARALR